ncbi:glutaredoxin-like protein NrdH [Actinomycetaceae bacterium MB13-C1-2]|nr:glutaredoxin-like protein NrdH [Actinomycetaceae bacterium MB13-C1-2]
MSANEEQVLVYSQPHCGQCEATKRALAKHGIAFTEIDLTTDPEALARVKAAGWMRAPVVETPDGQAWSGFRPDRIRDLTSPKTQWAPSSEPARSPTPQAMSLAAI